VSQMTIQYKKTFMVFVFMWLPVTRLAMTIGHAIKADFHSVQNVARSIFCDRFLLKCVQSTSGGGGE
jgi:hypothetical protein